MPSAHRSTRDGHSRGRRSAAPERGISVVRGGSDTQRSVAGKPRRPKDVRLEHPEVVATHDALDQMTPMPEGLPTESYSRHSGPLTRPPPGRRRAIAGLPGTLPTASLQPPCTSLTPPPRFPRDVTISRAFGRNAGVRRRVATTPSSGAVPGGGNREAGVGPVAPRPPGARNLPSAGGQVIIKPPSRGSRGATGEPQAVHQQERRR